MPDPLVSVLGRVDPEPVTVMVELEPAIVTDAVVVTAVAVVTAVTVVTAIAGVAAVLVEAFGSIM